MNTHQESRGCIASSSLTTSDEKVSKLSVEQTAELVCRYGGSSASILLDERCRHFQHPGIEGVIGYKQYGRHAIAMGDPVCTRQDMAPLIDAFGQYCANRRWHCIHAVVSVPLAAMLKSRGFGLIEFGVEQVLDPGATLAADPYKVDLRKKLKRARRAGLEVAEYCLRQCYDPALESRMEDMSRSWVRQRRGPQIYLAGINLFRAPAITRWFYGTVGGNIVAVLAMLKLEALDGYLIEHILYLPGAPVGTSEMMITRVLETLGREDCHYATFGPAPARNLGEVSGFSPATERFSKYIYRLSSRVFHLDAKVLYRRKFRPVAAQSLYLAFDPPVIGLSTLWPLLRSFNIYLPLPRLPVGPWRTHAHSSPAENC